MKLRWILLFVMASLLEATNLPAAAESSLDSILTWDNVSKSVRVPDSTNLAHLTFNFTNISSANVTITNVHPSCGCTTAKLPTLPWTIAPGTNGRIDITVNITGKRGTLSKAIYIGTDKGTKTIAATIIILTPEVALLSKEQRAENMKVAAVDRQAVFKGDCASCHVKPAEGKYGRELFQTACGICHEGPDRATMVPELHNLKVPTSSEFWQAMISQGKPGTLMPAFAKTETGPLTDMQIVSLAAYLNMAIPSHITNSVP